MGAALLLSGIVAAIATSPAFDRILTHHLGITVRILCPIVAIAWFSLIWAGRIVLLSFSLESLTYVMRIAVRPHNAVALFVIVVVIGVGSISLLPVAIELGVELTRNPDGSSALLWFLCAYPSPSSAPFRELIFLCSKRKSFMHNFYIM
jgi:MFS transporter, FLVCR family, MFS-domain-containing protein 7